jgi:hypothetical protein
MANDAKQSSEAAAREVAIASRLQGFMQIAVGVPNVQLAIPRRKNGIFA